MASDVVNVGGVLEPPVKTVTVTESDFLKLIGYQPPATNGGENVATQPGQQGLGYVGFLDGTNRQGGEGGATVTAGTVIVLGVLAVLAIATLKGKGL